VIPVVNLRQHYVNCPGVNINGRDIQVYGHHDKMARTKTHRTSQKNGVYKDATDIKK